MEKFYDTKLFFDYGLEIAKNVTTPLGIVLTMFAFITLFNLYSTRQILSSENLGLLTIAKAILLSLLCSFYPFIVSVFVGTTDYIVEIYAGKVNLNGFFSEFNMRLTNAAQQNTLGYEKTLVSENGIQLKDVRTETNMMLVSSSIFIYQIITSGFLILKNILLAIAVAVGPIAITLTQFKPLDKSIWSWVSFLMALGLWQMFLVLIYGALRYGIADAFFIPSDSPMPQVTLMCVIITLFFLIPFISSKIVQKSTNGYWHFLNSKSI